jgi:PPM family protein phosphatase
VKLKLFSRKSGFRTEVFSEKGLREVNEDSSIVVKFAQDCYYLAVADGMGGKSGGEIASRVVKLAIENYLHKEVPGNSEKSIKKHLEETFSIAQSAVLKEITVHPVLTGMGTTLTAVLIMNGKYAWGNLGDSRTYLLTDGKVRLITKDHSYIQDYLSGHKEELPASILNRYKNLVTRIIDGGKDTPDIYPPESESATLKDGDLFILCSDGLISDKIADQSEIIEEHARKYKNLQKMLKELVSSALANGSDDNITVVAGLQGELKVKPAEDERRTIRILNKS